MMFTINGADVSVSAWRRVSDLTGDAPLIAAVYQAFLDLHGLVPLTRLRITGNAVTVTCLLDRQDGGIWTQTVTLGGAALNPLVNLSYDATWRYDQLIRSRRLADALVALALTAKIGTLVLEP